MPHPGMGVHTHPIATFGVVTQFAATRRFPLLRRLYISISLRRDATSLRILPGQSSPITTAFCARVSLAPRPLRVTADQGEQRFGVERLLQVVRRAHGADAVRASVRGHDDDGDLA